MTRSESGNRRSSTSSQSGLLSGTEMTKKNKESNRVERDHEVTGTVDECPDDRIDKFKDECGVFGIFGHPEAANMTYLGLYALQHRGQESAGIAASDDEHVRLSREMGYVADIFDGEKLSTLPGRLAIGHVRYSTAGESKLLNAQP